MPEVQSSQRNKTPKQANPTTPTENRKTPNTISIEFPVGPHRPVRVKGQGLI